MFNEQNSVENFVRDLLCGPQPAAGARIGEQRAPYGSGAPAARPESLGWSFLPAAQLPRATSDVLVEPHLRDALIRLNPEIAARPDRADEVLYRLRAILLSVNADGLVRANEEFTAWLRGERSMPFGPHGEHTPVRLVDFEPCRDNRCLVVTQLVFTAGSQMRRFDLVLFVNGIPLVVGEAKTPTRPAVSWLDGAIQVHDDYEVNVPALLRAQRPLLRHRGQDLPLRRDPHGARSVGAVAGGRRQIRRDLQKPRRPPDLAKSKPRSAACCAPTLSSTSCAISPSSPPTRGTARSRSSAASSSTTRPTRSSSGWSRGGSRRG